MKLQTPKFFDFKFKLMNKNLLLLLLCVTVLVQCARSSEESTQDVYNPQLPAITTTGANTFGCKINGVVMVPRNSIGYIPPGSNHYPCHYANENNNYPFEILSAYDLRESKRGGAYIYLQGVPNYNTPIPIGDYPIFNGIIPQNPDFNDNYKTYILFVFYDAQGIGHNYVSIENTGYINVIKSDAQILSATFSCKAKNVSNANEIITITDGRFDINKNTIGITNFN
ncbi:hypothetical protein [Frigoriflavimonas asaccharolytica]|uniref:Lipoprotein n=1 Tax=Frigoriflavimonas asaccharolytica TaxID=2735899 RepID=A0A8J8K766_9FLAO|nr:hypothetical protein [Frigoriflavimonas asaccharolytica]NRS91683.1 hypothetical protein [Frigoriflavimonas asaccharolytica]